jgi:hypothetical protein
LTGPSHFTRPNLLTSFEISAARGNDWPINRVDADVLAWFRARGKKYQTYMNEVLRREMQHDPPGR